MKEEQFWLVVSNVVGINYAWPYLETLKRCRRDAIRAFEDAERRDYGDHELTWKRRKLKKYPDIIRNARAIRVIVREAENET